MKIFLSKLTRVLLLVVLVVFTNCEKDEVEDYTKTNLTKHESNGAIVTSSYINWQEFNRKTALDGQSEFFQGFIVGNRSLDNEIQVSTESEITTEHLLVDEIEMHEYEGITTYTFVVQEQSEDNTFRNLVLKTEDNIDFEAYIIRYTPTEQWLSSDQDTTPYEGDIEVFDYQGTYEVVTESNETCSFSVDFYWVCELGYIGHYPGRPGCVQTNFEYVVAIYETCTANNVGGSVVPGSSDTSPGDGNTGEPSNYYGGTVNTNPNNDTSNDLNLTRPRAPRSPANLLVSSLDLDPFQDDSLIGWLNDSENSNLVDELTTFLVDEQYAYFAIQEAKMRARKEYADATDGWTMLDNPATYENREGMTYIGTHNPPNTSGTMYLLENYDVLFVTQTPRIISRQDSFMYQTTIVANEELAYHYIYKEDNKRWYNAIMPYPNNDCLSCHLDEFFQAVLENSGIILGRYVLPVEDAYIAFTGEDFDGVASSRAVAASFILVDFIPGSKIVKSIKFIKFGDEAVQVADVVIKKIDDVMDAFTKGQRHLVEVYKDQIANMSSLRKGNFGEMATDVDMISRGFEPVHLRGNRINTIDHGGHNGIDHVFKNPETGEYLIIEAKYKPSGDMAYMNPPNNTTNLPKQMSDDWLTHNDNFANAIGNEDLAADILASVNYKKLVSVVNPDGTITYRLIDEFGNVITGSAGIYNP